MKIIKLARLWLIRQLRNIHLWRQSNQSHSNPRACPITLPQNPKRNPQPCSTFSSPAWNVYSFCFLIHELRKKRKCKTQISLCPWGLGSWGWLSFIMTIIRQNRYGATMIRLWICNTTMKYRLSYQRYHGGWGKEEERECNPLKTWTKGFKTDSLKCKNRKLSYMYRTWGCGGLWRKYFQRNA